MPSKSFTDLFIRKPVIALVVNIVILVVGVVSYFELNTRQYPRSDSAVVNVNTVYFGASADTVRGYITTQLERAIASADGIDYIESTSSAGFSSIKVFLRLNYDSNAALAQISAKLDQVRNELPPESESPTISVETSDSEFASMYLSFYSDDLDQNQITDYLNRMVQPRLAAIKGIQKADVLGGRVFAMRVWLKPEELAARGLSPAEVRAALQANNALAAVGATKGSMISVSLVADTDLKNVEQFRQLVVAEKNGTLIRLEDVADVVLGAESYDEEVRFGGKTATFMGLWVLPTESTVEVMQRVREAFPDIQASLPAGLNGMIAYDATQYIEDALHEIVKTLTETLLIVTLVIFLFMGSLRSVIIPIVAMPLSLVGAMFLMLAFGFTINLLTLLAIVLAVGIVVDDAIVVVENVERHIREGLTPIDAAIAGARELVGPVISMTITLSAVYAPIAFQGGLTGALFREFAMTLAGAVAVSGFVALTLSPMMSAYLLKGGDAEEKGLAGTINHLFDRVRDRYEKIIGASLGWVPVTITAATLLTLLLVPFFLLAQRELAPKEDQGVVFSLMIPSPTATIDQNMIYAQEVQKMFEQVPEYDNSFQITGARFGFSGIILKPWSERSRNTTQIEESLQGPAAAVSGLNVVVTSPDPLPAGGSMPIDFVVRSTADHREMEEFAQKLALFANTEANAGGGAPTFYFADTDLRFDLPQVEIEIDKDKVAAMGLNLSDVARDLGSMLGGGYVNRFVNDGRSYRVIPQVERGQRLNAEQLLDYHIRGPQGQLIPLSTIATLKETVQPRTLNRFQQLNSVKIQGVGPSVDLALKKLEAKAKEILPAGYSIDYGGQSRQLRYEGNALWSAGALALILIFLVLAAQFNSFRDPFVILLGSVPLALVGAMLPIFLWQTSLNIYSQIGLITLVGLIAKNGILIVEFANSLQEQGVAKAVAIRRAAATRLRPVLMTSAATVFGHLMLIFVNGPGAAARNSIGWVLVVGMAVGSLFTLYVVPAFYMLIARDHAKAARPAPTSVVAEPVLAK
ncbi:Efflux pump membrane transporter BepE [Lacunisphaera limnophila]|uniref:Efflux pump membrane transporter BepE n=1 Tax=Lacunisphaera limnophila TaxID=1838286 RepID=A0A1D8AZC3_9BACT|nr:efflux RND transporter permease subunit [Lacunisphaera limnophila]AOS46227.1 Efflux pump membrane transporter BepE [Lacunisphaera limnophila]